MDVEKEVIKIVVEELGVDPEEINSESSFIEDLRADSLDAVEMILQVEDGFGIDIPDEDAKKMTTVGEIVKYVKEKKELKSEK